MTGSVLFDDFDLCNDPAATGADAPPRHRWRLPRLRRLRLSEMSFKRLSLGGRVGDFGRLPRYGLILLLSLSAIWIPVMAYLQFAPRRYASEVSLILPGAGASSTINLSDIGQASSSANSAYSSSTLSPTVTYQSMLQSAQVRERAAATLGMELRAIPKPTVKLLDQTSLIDVSMKAASPELARQMLRAVMDAFLVELDALRNDEISRREESTIGPVKVYRDDVDAVRRKISRLQMDTGLMSRDQYNTFIAANDVLRAKIDEQAALFEDTSRKVASLAGTLRVTPEHAASTLMLRADPLFTDLAATLAKDLALLAEMSQRLGPNHPKRALLQAQTDGARAKMLQRAKALTPLSDMEVSGEINTATDTARAALLSQLVSMVADRDGQGASLASQRAALAAGEEKVRSLAGAAAQLDTLTSNFKVAEAVFASALARINTSKTDIFASYPMVQFAKTPTLAEEPSSPSLIIALVSGVAGSFFLLIGLVLAWIRRPVILAMGRFLMKVREND